MVPYPSLLTPLGGDAGYVGSLGPLPWNYCFSTAMFTNKEIADMVGQMVMKYYIYMCLIEDLMYTVLSNNTFMYSIYARD